MFRQIGSPETTRIQAIGNKFFVEFFAYAQNPKLCVVEAINSLGITKMEG